MAAPRCPHCDVVLTEAEAAAGMCPDCAAPVADDSAPFAAPVDPLFAAPAGGGRLGFSAGLIAGAVLALSAAAAWWAWGPGLRPAEAADGSRPDDRGTAARAEARVRTLLEAADRAELRRAAAQDELAEAQALAEVAEERVAALQQAAAEAEALAQAVRSSAADIREAEDRAQRARLAAQQVEARRAATEQALAEARARLQATQVQQANLDRQLTAAQARLQAAKGKEDQARQAEADAQRGRQTAERQLADVRARLQTAQAQAAALDKALEERKAKLADRDRAIEAKKAQLADLDRAAAAGRGRPGPLSASGPPLPSLTASPDAPKAGGGFVREWLVVGPFADPDRKGHATAFAPESEAVDPGKDYKGIGALLRWRPHASPADYVDLGTLFRTHDPAVAYAVCWVRPDRARSARLSLGSNDGIRVWVNGKPVADRAVSRSAAPGQDWVPCELAAGWNELRVKVDNTGGPWGFYLEVQEPGGKGPLGGLEFRVKPPDPKPKR